MAFFKVMYPQLVGALTLQCGGRPAAEEIAQEALVRAWERWGQVRSMTSPKGWVFRVAFNLATSRARRVLAERRALGRLGRPDGAARSVDVAAGVAVREALGELPDRQRAAIVLRYFADLSVVETAEVLRCAPGTVKALTSQGVAGLRVRLVGFEGEEPSGG